MLLLVQDIIGVVDNVKCKPQSNNVVFHIRDFRLLSIEYNDFFVIVVSYY